MNRHQWRKIIAINTSAKNFQHINSLLVQHKCQVDQELPTLLCTSVKYTSTICCTSAAEDIIQCTIGVGAGPAGPVLAGPLFRQCNGIHYKYLHTHRYQRRAIRARLLQPDHFKVLPTPLCTIFSSGMHLPQDYTPTSLVPRVWNAKLCMRGEPGIFFSHEQHQKQKRPLIGVPATQDRKKKKKQRQQATYYTYLAIGRRISYIPSLQRIVG